MKLGFDMDGIVADMAGAMVVAMNEKYGLNHRPEIFVHHNLFENSYVGDEEINKEIAEFMHSDVIRNPAAVLELEAHEEAAVAIRKLRRQHSLHFITGRSPEQQNTSIEWLRRHNIPFDSVHAVGKAAKGMTGRSLNLDFYIDDQLEHLESMYKYKSRWRKGLALYTRPWNKDEAVDVNKFLRFDDWNFIARHLGVQNR